jgi:hypothetical protein
MLANPGRTTRTKQSPARSPGRAHFVSFNFTNTTIRRMSSTAATDFANRAEHFILRT